MKACFLFLGILEIGIREYFSYFGSGFMGIICSFLTCPKGRLGRALVCPIYMDEKIVKIFIEKC
jgi:hypothetical protein